MNAAGTTILSASPFVALALMIVAWIKIGPELKRLANEREVGLIATLSGRVTTLESGARRV